MARNINPFTVEVNPGTKQQRFGVMVIGSDFMSDHYNEWERHVFYDTIEEALALKAELESLTWNKNGRYSLDTDDLPSMIKEEFGYLSDADIHHSNFFVSVLRTEHRMLSDNDIRCFLIDEVLKEI